MEYSDGQRIVRRVGEPTAGGAYAKYEVVRADAYADGKVPAEGDDIVLETIQFQSDTIPAIGVQGVTIECLLRIAEDRLGCFQKGGFDCPENAIALNATRAARQALEYRTALRAERGVEGKHEA